MKIKEKLGKLFLSLQPGDLLFIPITLLAESTTMYSAVLRLGEAGEIYLSCPRESAPITKPCCQNPIHWDAVLGALVGSDGEPMGWYSDDIQVVRGEAMNLVTAYNQIPRRAAATVAVSDEVAKQFAMSPLHTVVHGIADNGEAGGIDEQLSLVLEQLGITHTTEQLAALQYFVETKIAKRLVEREKQMLIMCVTADSIPGDTPPVGCTVH